MKVLNVVGARPNFMKMAPIVRAMNRYPEAFQHFLVHTGQHYDAILSDAFFRDLDLPTPDITLGAGSDTTARQIGRIMMLFEETCIENRPDLVLVVGDVNSTLACALTAKTLGIRIAHVEAGNRSGDLTMQEEVNRLCTDAFADLLFASDRIATANLERENIAADRIHFVGNVMIDTLFKHRAAAAKLPLRDELGLTPGGYGLVTLHRPSNVDDRETLKGILEALREIAEDLPLVLPMHPRTRKMVDAFGFANFFTTGGKARSLYATPPLSYLEFLSLMLSARLVLTDSGGIQEETTALGIPCLTLRNTTERPVTCSEGTNRLIGTGKQAILDAGKRALSAPPVAGKVPEKWDGKAAERIVAVLRDS